MSRWPAEVIRRPFRGLIAVALLSLAPKCALCVLAYTGIVGVLGLRGPEFCSVTNASPIGWWTYLAVLGMGLVIAALLACLRPRRNSSASIRGRRHKKRILEAEIKYGHRVMNTQM